MKGVERLPDAPPQPGAQPDLAQSTIDRAVERLYRPIGPEMLSKTARGLDHVANDQPQPDPPNVPGASRLSAKEETELANEPKTKPAVLTGRYRSHSHGTVNSSDLGCRGRLAYYRSKRSWIHLRSGTIARQRDH